MREVPSERSRKSIASSSRIRARIACGMSWNILCRLIYHMLGRGASLNSARWFWRRFPLTPRASKRNAR